MSHKQLFTVAEAATLIAKVTGKNVPDIGNDIMFARRYGGLRFRATNPAIVAALVGVGDWGDKTDNPLRTYDDAPSDFYHVHINEVLNALGYHPDIQAKILAERDKPAQAGGSDATNNKASAWRQQVRDEATRWCRERQAEGKPKPTKIAVAEEMAVWCRNNEVKTDTGICPSVETIRRHILDKWKHP